jgi:hypothetical protein
MIRRGQTANLQERLDISERAEAFQSDESRLRLPWGAQSGPCANGEVLANSKDAQACIHR